MTAMFQKESPLELDEAELGAQELAKVDNLHDQRKEADILKDLNPPQLIAYAQ